MENIRIRALEASDANDIAQIYSAIVRKPLGKEFTALIENHARNTNDICFVAEIDGRVIGFMISYVLPFSFGIEQSAWIATLGVDPEFMGHRIGNTLAQKIFKRYKEMGIKRVYTSVSWNSVDVLSFFNHLQFERSDFINLTKDLEQMSSEDEHNA
ncbi:MAG: GNAT family N-acetyltransferase [Desulfovermiculus sp.]|nr:GNAT family N-acetyltransferase [Desulfovermiculus sp.]